MSSLALRRGRGFACAELPPTLQPHAIAASAPGPDHLRTLVFSGLIYALLGGLVLLLSAAPSRTSPTRLPPTVPTRVEDFVEALRPPLTRIMLTGSTGGGAVVPSTRIGKAPAPSPDPSAAPAGFSTEDRRDQIPLGNDPAGTQSTTPFPGSRPGALPGIQELGHSSLAIRSQVEPIYPDFARKAHLQGAVVLHLVVDETGQPIQVEVLEGHPIFHQVAIQAARQWRFEPARVDGQPVPASFRLTLKFSLR